MKEKYQYQYQKLRDASKLLKDNQLQFILKDILEEEDFFHFQFGLENDFVFFSKEDGEKIYLDLSDFNPVFVRRRGEYLVERICLNLSDGIHDKSDIIVNHTLVEDRPSGILVRVMEKCYSNLGNSAYVKDMVSLVEETYGYRTKTLVDANLFMNFFDWNCLRKGLSAIEVEPDFYSQLKISDSSSKMELFVDGKDYSDVYSTLDGKRLVSRIYQLYYGEITELSSRDLYCIYLGKLREDAFGLREVLGISERLNQVIGNSICEKPTCYYQYVNSFLADQLHVTCDDLNNRDALLKSILKRKDLILQEVENTSVDFSLEKEKLDKKVKKKRRLDFGRFHKKRPN